MDNDAVVEQIVRSLSFEVVAITHDVIEADYPAKSTPLNVKITVRKKGNAGLPDGVISMSKMDQKEYVPGRVRLVSSDQTIMSFNVVMDGNNDNQNLTMVQPVPGSSYKADIATSSGINSDGVVKSRFTLSKKDNKFNTSPVLSKKNKDILFGRCKPGGCLDPPFGEDRYPYKPANETSSQIKSSTTEESNKIRSSSIFKNNPFKKKRKSTQDDEVYKHDITSPTKHDSVLNLYEKGSLPGSTTYSTSIITYPPTTNSNDQLIQEPRHSKIRHSSEERPSKIRYSSDERSSTASYFIVPKKAKNQLEQTGKNLENESVIGDNKPDNTENVDDNPQYRTYLLKTASEPKISEKSNITPLSLLPLALPLSTNIDDIIRDDENKPLQSPVNVTQNLVDEHESERIDPKTGDINKLRHSLEPADPLLQKKDDNRTRNEEINTGLKRDSAIKKHSEEDIPHFNQSLIPSGTVFFEDKNNVAETRNNQADLIETKNIPIIIREENSVNKHDDSPAQLLSDIVLENIGSNILEDNINLLDLELENNDNIMNDYTYDSQTILADGEPPLTVPIILSQAVTDNLKECNLNTQTGSFNIISNLNITHTENIQRESTTTPTDFKTKFFETPSRKSSQIAQKAQNVSENSTTPLKSDDDSVLNLNSYEAMQQEQNVSENSYVPLATEANFILKDSEDVQFNNFDNESKLAEIFLADEELLKTQKETEDLEYLLQDSKIPKDVTEAYTNAEIPSDDYATKEKPNESDLSFTDMYESMKKSMPAAKQENFSEENTSNTSNGLVAMRRSYDVTLYTGYQTKQDKIFDDESFEVQDNHDFTENVINNFETDKEQKQPQGIIESNSYNKKYITIAEDGNHTYNDILNLILSSDETETPQTLLKRENETKNHDRDLEGNADYDNTFDIDLVTRSDNNVQDDITLEKQITEPLSDKKLTQDLGTDLTKQPPENNEIDFSNVDITLLDTDVSRKRLISTTVLQKGVGPWKVDVALHSFTNKNNERIVKSFDSDNVPEQYLKDALIIAKCSLKNDTSEFKMPLDNENELTIQIKSNKANPSLTDLYDNVAEPSHRKKKIKIKVLDDNMENTDYDDNITNKSEANKHRNVMKNDDNLHDALISIYDQELVPLQGVIKGLREEIDMLTAYRMMLRGKSDTKRWKPPKLTNGRRCGCSKRL